MNAVNLCLDFGSFSEHAFDMVRVELSAQKAGGRSNDKAKKHRDSADRGSGIEPCRKDPPDHAHYHHWHGKSETYDNGRPCSRFSDALPFYAIKERPDEAAGESAP